MHGAIGKLPKQCSVPHCVIYFAMIILSWNVRGIGRRTKCLGVHNLINLYKYDIVMQESKLASPNHIITRSIGGNCISSWSHLDSIGAAGRQLIGWRDGKFECISELAGEFILLVHL